MRSSIVRGVRSLIGVTLVVAIVGALAYASLGRDDPGTAVEADGTRVETGAIDTPGAAPREGATAPDFVLAGYDGRAVRLSDYRGKTVLLNFWATWCTTCEAEMPDMQRLAEEHPDELVVLAVNQAEGSRQAKGWSDARGLTSLVFALDASKSVTDAYKLPSGLPHSFFIDKDGYVRAVVHGGMRYEEMRDLLEETRVAATSAGSE